MILDSYLLVDFEFRTSGCRVQMSHNREFEHKYEDADCALHIFVSFSCPRLLLIIKFWFTLFLKRRRCVALSLATKI